MKALSLSLMVVLLCALPALGSALVVCGSLDAVAMQGDSVMTAFYSDILPGGPRHSMHSDISLSSSGYVDGQDDLCLAGPIDDVLNPSAASADAATGQGGHLLMIPSTFLLTLVGFLCVTVVRDRRKWAALAAILFAAGGSGILSLPRLAMRITSAHKESLAPTGEVVREPSGEADAPLRAETNFAGLLKRLGSEGGRRPLIKGLRLDLTHSLPAVGRKGIAFSAAGFFFPAAITPKVFTQRYGPNGFVPLIGDCTFPREYEFFGMRGRPPPLGNRVRERTARTRWQVRI